MWRERIKRVTHAAEFAQPASQGHIEAAERVLKIGIPDELRGLLLESDGVVGEYGLGLVWPIARIESDNLQFRTMPDYRELYMPFDVLLFFADAGNGDHFGFPIQAGAIRRPDVFAWNHEDDSRCWVAPSLERYLDWWLSGKLKL
jgi:hypothetical protein